MGEMYTMLPYQNCQCTVVILITKTLQLMEIFDYVGENFHIQGPNMHYHWNKKIDTWKVNEKENEDKKDEFWLTERIRTCVTLHFIDIY